MHDERQRTRPRRPSHAARRTPRDGCAARLPRPADASRIESAASRRADARRSVVHDVVLPHAQHPSDRAARAVSCDRPHPIDPRCARRLLTAHDRVGGAARLRITQEPLALMLGVRRASVSLAAAAPRTAGLIRYRRGRITVVDRPRRGAAGCACCHTDRADRPRMRGLAAPCAAARAGDAPGAAARARVCPSAQRTIAYAMCAASRCAADACVL